MAPMYVEMEARLPELGEVECSSASSWSCDRMDEFLTDRLVVSLACLLGWQAVKQFRGRWWDAVWSGARAPHNRMSSVVPECIADANIRYGPLHTAW